MKRYYFVTIVLLFFLFACSSPKQNKKGNKGLVKREDTIPNAIDTIVTGKWLPFVPVVSDTVIPGPKSKFVFMETQKQSSPPLQVESLTVPKRNDDLIDTVTGLKPAIQFIQPLVTTAVFPEPITVKDFRSVSNTNYDVQYLDAEQGLPTSSIKSIVQDKNGLLWLGTPAGLICYDGTRIFQFRKQHGLHSNRVSEVTLDHKNRLWMITGDRITMYDGRKFYTYGDDFLPKQANISDIFLDKNGEVWIAAFGDGLFRLNEKKVYFYKQSTWLASHFPMCVTVDAIGRTWVGSWGGNMSVLHEDTAFIHKGRWTYRCSDVVMSAFCDSQKNLWFTSYNGGITKYVKGCRELITWNIKGDFSPIYHTETVEDSKGTMWWGSDRGGLSCLKPDGKMIQYTTKQGLTDNNVNAVFCDKFGVVWIGTESGGLCKLNPESFVQVNDQDGLIASQTTTFFEDNAHNYFAGTWAAGLYMHYKNEWKALGEDLGYLIILDALEDHEHNVWISTHNFGIRRAIRSRPDSLFEFTEKYQTQNGLPVSMVYDMLEDDDRNLWFCDANVGLVRYAHKRYDWFKVGRGTNYVPACAISQASDGTIWVANSFHGVSCIKENKIKHFTTREGLLENEICKVFVDANDLVWIAYRKGGFSVYDGTKFTHYQYINNIDIPMLCNFANGKNNSVWSGTSNGLLHLQPNSKAKDGMKMDVYTIADGAKTNSYSLNAPYLDSKHNIWLTTGRGLTKVNESVLTGDALMPEVRILSVSVNGKFVSWNLPDTAQNLIPNDIQFTSVLPYTNIPSNLTLTHNNNNLSFDFTGIQWRKPARVQYRFRLKGFSENWSQPSEKTTTAFNNLGGGSYTFEVQARLHENAWSKAATFDFVIYPPWWKTWWFRGILIVLSLIIVYIFFRARTTHLRKKAEALEQVVQERTLEIAEQKKVIEEKQKETVDSINYAKRIQYALLAQDVLLKQNLSDHFVFFLPKDIVSGDFYWASVHNNRFYLAVCDSTGHGVPGAFMSLLNISYLNEAINEKSIQDPGLTLDYVRARLIENISKEGQQDGMDGVLLEIDKSTSTYRYAAANNPPVVVNTTSIAVGAADKMPVGKSEKKELFSTHSISYQKGDMLYMITDGFADQFGGNKKSGGKKFKRSNLYALLQTICHLPVNEQRQKLRDALLEWKGELEQMDDICVVGIRL